MVQKLNPTVSAQSCVLSSGCHQILLHDDSSKMSYFVSSCKKISSRHPCSHYKPKNPFQGEITAMIEVSRTG
ncbi:uncharacterized protein PHALS_15205 [Plasmopara halstedii]|uniref:Uncharacterized protein n=1 Tax=Plasmopara halstedii TaxID=4781 RepID=A0A0P1B596_PLAHL|nr:uncharacterized protein PHALS_15205 [Plasmopara halstedii]CEG48840.1 hypothetical protein PHALS_15205 [Plasmopara halstedii]|eukprot:XP_024585209.1 hypothetical protein PHALS_15205 [Plasmopara halstedii]